MKWPPAPFPPLFPRSPAPAPLRSDAPVLPCSHAPLLPLYHTTASNFLVDAEDALYIIDWENPILAPKERDLIFIDGAQGFRGYSAQEEEILFYRGYGQM